MAAGDKIRNAGEKAAGKAKEAAGAVAGNETLRADGRAEQTKGDLKQAGEKVKDAFKKH
ncbi:CsbD family protein [Pseudarthrobacter phenanthrenivorans]|uniref:CsbD family protein n=1 Tax=Pseudarthrobacter phenanthrenivorans TaxID=361575 RepID=UPI00344B41E0